MRTHRMRVRECKRRVMVDVRRRVCEIWRCEDSRGADAVKYVAMLRTNPHDVCGAFTDGVGTDAPHFVQQIAELHVFEHDPAAVEVARHGMHVMSSNGRSGEGTSQVRAQANEPPRDKGK